MNYRPRYNSSWLWGGFLLALLIPAAPALALQGVGVSPTSQEVALTPGQTQTGTLTVINDGASDVTYHLYAADYHVKGEDYQGSFTALGSGANISPISWFKLPTGNFVVKAHDEIIVSYSVTPPLTASVGGHYASIFVETVPPPNPGGTRIARVDRIGSLFYLTVAGQLIQKGALLPLNAAWLQSVPPLQLALRLRNDGNVHYIVEGTVQLSTPFGTLDKPTPFKREILPSTTRRLDLSLATHSPIGLYKITATVNYLGRTETLSKWVLLMPRVTFLIISGTVLLLLVLGFIRLTRRGRRR